MSVPRATPPVDTTDHPLRAALAMGERAYAQSAPALHQLLVANDDTLIAPVVVAQVRGLLADLARQLVEALVRPDAAATAHEAMLARLLSVPALSAHCQALAIEWRVAQRLEAELAIDPVLSPLMQEWVGHGEGALDSLTMAALAAQARFAQGQRRMQLSLGELPAELFHAVLTAADDVFPSDAPGANPRGQSRLRGEYDEAEGRQALLARLAREAPVPAAKDFAIEDAGVSLWLSVVAGRSGEDRDRTACAAADPHLGRLLLTLRAGGTPPAEAERQVLRLQPDAILPAGLVDVGTREAAQWLADIRQ